MTDEMTCFDCRYFSPGDYGCPSYICAQQLGEFEEGKAGVCRRHTPRHGETLTHSNGQEFICFAQWPKVMACDWCGEFEPRTQHPYNAQRRNAHSAQEKGDCE